jgi:hypothetical protein
MPLTGVDKLKFETLFSLGSGYVMDFSNPTFGSFVNGSIKEDIFSTKYENYGTSKAKRLKSLWELADDKKVGRLLEELVQYYITNSKLKPNDETFKKPAHLPAECLEIAQRLQGKTVKDNTSIHSEDDFLKLELDEVAISSLKIDGTVSTILESRIKEIKQCMKANAPLAVVFLCGSVLEGLLLGVATGNMRAFNEDKATPKDSTGKPKQFHEWTLANFIDVAGNTGHLGLDVKKHSHSLRDFRNYIHPYQQMSSRFTPDMHTAKIGWQVLKAAIHDIHQKK